MQKILLINGPNLNMLGKREPQHYGNETLVDIEQSLTQSAVQQGVELVCFQSNSEEKMIDRIHDSLGMIDFIIINPAALTHTSIALRDALLSVNIPFIEVHLSNIHRRETFRHHSYLSDKAVGVICGLGSQGYHYALSYAMTFLNNKNKQV